MTSMTTTGGGGSGFSGADVDGLDKVAQDCTTAAQVVDEVKAVLEAIVAASFLFGPFGAAFISYLKTVVIPWLTKISEALKLFAKVLSANSQSQREASSSTTSLPSYQTPANLPTSSTANYPTLPTTVGSSGGGGGGATSAPTSGGGSGSTVSQPPSIGGTTGSTGSTGAGTTGTGSGETPTTPGSTTGTGTTAAQSPAVAKITALTGLVTAIDHLLHPNSSTAGATPTDPTGGALGGGTGIGGTDPTGGGTLGTDPTGGGTLGTDPTGGGTLGGTPTDPTGGGTGLGSAPGLGGGIGTGIGNTPDPIQGSTGAGTSIGHLGTGMNFHQTGTLPNGDIVGRLSMPAEISPSGQITPLTHGELNSIGAGSGGGSVAPISSAPAQLTPLHDTSAVTPTHSGSGSGMSSGGGGLSGGGGFSGGGGTTAPAPVVHTADASVPTTSHSATAAAPAHHATTATHSTSASSSNHDGLYSGLGQATGIGAGAGAIAKASLSEAKQAADGALVNAADLPFDAGSDAATQGAVFSGTVR